jgi:predicted nucleic acid-binding protein
VTQVLLDTNVVLDVLADREPFAEGAAAVMAAIEAGIVQGFVAAHTITTLHYLLSKHVGKAKARRVLTDLMQILNIVSVDEERLRQALGLNWADFEDAVQAACAEHVGATYLVTRDKKGFRRSAIEAIAPPELLAIIGS